MGKCRAVRIYSGHCPEKGVLKEIKVLQLKKAKGGKRNQGKRPRTRSGIRMRTPRRAVLKTSRFPSLSLYERTTTQALNNPPAPSTQLQSSFL